MMFYPPLLYWQERKIYDQLSMGIRYFDFRVAAKPNDPSCELYFAHMIYTHLTVMVSTIFFFSVEGWIPIPPLALNLKP